MYHFTSAIKQSIWNELSTKDKKVLQYEIADAEIIELVQGICTTDYFDRSHFVSQNCYTNFQLLWKLET